MEGEGLTGPDAVSYTHLAKMLIINGTASSNTEAETMSTQLVQLPVSYTHLGAMLSETAE